MHSGYNYTYDAMPGRVQLHEGWLWCVMYIVASQIARFGEKYSDKTFCKHFSYSPHHYSMWGVWKVLTKCLVRMLCSPNEDFRWLNEQLATSLRIIFQGCEYSIWATPVWKSFEKKLPTVRSAIENLRLVSINVFDVPKSSFGEHGFSKNDWKEMCNVPRFMYSRITTYDK